MTDYLPDDIYHYASASYQFGRLTPPPPAPSLAEDQTGDSPRHNPHNPQKGLTSPEQGGNHSSRHKSFSTVVYQAPSLNDVDEAHTPSRVSELRK